MGRGMCSKRKVNGRTAVRLQPNLQDAWSASVPARYSGAIGELEPISKQLQKMRRLPTEGYLLHCNSKIQLGDAAAAGQT